MFTGREYDREIMLYYNRARYYDANLGRFISQDPIGIADNVDLYSYVGNNPVNRTDRMGLTKVLIFLGTPHNESERPSFILALRYQIEQALTNGTKPSDIVIAKDVMSPQKFNLEDKQYLGNIKKVIYIAHGSPLISGGITEENASKLNSLKVDANDNPSVLLVSCETGQGEDSVAQSISNALDVQVTAGDNIVQTLDEKDMEINLINLAFHREWIGAGLLGLKPGEPRVQDGSWHTFSPNN